MQVSWYKDSNLLSESESVKFRTEESRHTLILRSGANLNTDYNLTSIPMFFSSIHTGFDFGNYSCVAENSIGTFKYVNWKIYQIYINLFFFIKLGSILKYTEDPLYRSSGQSPTLTKTGWVHWTGLDCSEC